MSMTPSGWYSDTFSLSTDGSRLCTCGGDSVVRMLDLASQCEILFKKSPEVFQ